MIYKKILLKNIMKFIALPLMFLVILNFYFFN